MIYRYSPLDQQIVDQRVTQFRYQTQRYLNQQITDEQFLPLRLQNGLYIQRLAPMLRISVPYGCISSDQIRQIAKISRDYDKGYVHLTTRQNIQINWPKLEEVPDILADLAKVQMHAIQTSGNCIRNFTSDPFAGVCQDEIVDPRPYCEVLRQWATLHPEFAFLPRKFKIAVIASEQDRAAILAHDIGLRIVNGDSGIGFQVFVGGGLGRTPVIGSEIYSYVPLKDIIRVLNAILRVYNLKGRRDNKYKARIKILVRALGVEQFRQLVDEQRQLEQQITPDLTPEQVDSVAQRFTQPNYQPIDGLLAEQQLQQQGRQDSKFKQWVADNCKTHKVNGYTAVVATIKTIGVPTGDITAEQLDSIATIADDFSMCQMVLTHDQNIVFPYVRKDQLYDLWLQINQSHLQQTSAQSMQDMICCPGGDYCSLANAKSIPVAELIQRQYSQSNINQKLGSIQVKISGCMNACGHHHIGHIGVLGVDKKGEEWYQILLGGRSDQKASLAKILGPSVARHQISAVIDAIIQTYQQLKNTNEQFIDTVHRVGLEPFKVAVYGKPKN